MNPIIILLVGMVVVVGAILVLRLHAFLALLLGALIVAALTNKAQILSQQIGAASAEVVSIDDGGLLLSAGRGRNVTPGRNHVFRDGNVRPVGALDLGSPVPVAEVTDQVRANIDNNPGNVRIRPGDRILHHTRLSTAKSTAARNPAERIANGFGEAARQIGILIAMAAIIGKCLLDSGGAERIVLAARNLFGEDRAPFAFLGSGFLLGVPVFFDTVFYLMLPLGKAMHLRTARNYVLYVLAIVAGASIAHSLVPPTPGPLFVAESLGVGVGTMMIAGTIVGLFALTAGYGYARWADHRWNIPLRASAELTAEELHAMAERDESTLPPLWFSLLPIVMPVMLIAGGAVIASTYAGGDEPTWFGTAMTFADKNIALILGASAALALLVFRNGAGSVTRATQTAIASGGVIILITSAGGAFGHVLRQTDIASAITALVPAAGLDRMLLPIAFALTTLIRIAQGSGTVAMITSVGIVGPVASGIDLGYHPVYLALAIGAGSKPIPWMNDSGFWVISKMSGFTEAETLKTASVTITLMGVVALIVLLLGAWLLPLV